VSELRSISEESKANEQRVLLVEDVKKLFKVIDGAYARHLAGVYSSKKAIAARGLEVGLELSDEGKKALEESEPNEVVEKTTEKKLVYGTRDERWHLVGPEDRDYKHGISPEEFKKLGSEKAKEKYLAARKVESRTNEAAEVPQTMQPQEKPNINAEDYHMEDYSEEDLEKVKSKSAETGNAIRQVEDDELKQEPDKVTKSKKESVSVFARQKPLWLCNSCFKTFRSDENICSCESTNTEKITEGEGWAVGHLKYIYNVEFEVAGKKDSTRVEAFDEPDAKRLVQRIKPGARIIGVKKIGEGKSPKQGDKEATQIKKLSETVSELISEVPGISKEDQLYLKWALNKNLISNTWPEEDAINDALAEVTNQVPEKEMYDPAFDNQSLYLKYVLLPKARVEAIRMGVSVPKGIGEQKEDWDLTFKYTHDQLTGNPLLDKGGNPYLWEKHPIEGRRVHVFTDYQAGWVAGKGATPVRETKVQEQEKDTYTTVARGVVDKAEADRLARDKKGIVVADEEDPKKFMIIVKEA
jgi:hypothetical protein